MTAVTGTLTILTDNTVPGKSDLLGEHGFSVYLETSAGNYLFETGDMANRFAERDGETVEDRIADDQSLILDTRRGLFIVLGCAHAGVINVIKQAVQLTGIDRIYAIVGGTHLDFVEDAQVEKTIDALGEYSIEHLMPSHCTGARVTARLSREFATSFEFSHVGKSVSF